MFKAKCNLLDKVLVRDTNYYPSRDTGQVPPYLFIYHSNGLNSIARAAKSSKATLKVRKLWGKGVVEEPWSWVEKWPLTAY
ncbi:hypothetical protein XENTR_v10022784 [Xenopus tropicalis]|nr:hypothetical protein XENTR_v10022784 [Xenopus tropicalis]